LREQLGREALEQGGFVVTTSVDAGLQEDLRAIAFDHVNALRAQHDLTAASVVAIHPATGEILAMVGGIDYDDPSDGQVNMAAHPRQLGSTFKPIAYAEALEQGWTPASVLWDIPHRFNAGTGGEEYRPVNYDGRFRGPVRLRFALANSMNAAAIDLTAAIGFPSVHRRARTMGLPLDEDAGRYGLSITLGAGDVPLVAMTGAYSSFANDGNLAAPTAILRIDPMDGGPARYIHEVSPKAVVSPQTAYLISDMLSDAEARRAAFGDGETLRLSQTAAVKTGTSNDFRDNTTIGYTRAIAVGVWTGNKDNRPMRNVLGITGAAPIWKASMERILGDEVLMAELNDGLPSDGPAFPRPKGIVDGRVCDLSTLSRQGACRQYDERFAEGSRIGEEGRAYGRFVSPGGAGGCGQSAPAGTLDGQMYVILDRTPTVARVIQAWAERNGVRVSAPPCGGS
jgi:membrane peptidoglycan carboxypeptidase